MERIKTWCPDRRDASSSHQAEYIIAWDSAYRMKVGSGPSGSLAKLAN